MIAVHTPFWWINHPWRPCLLCNVPYHQGRRCLATLHMLLHERIHPLKVAWNPRLAMFIVCVACEFEECTDHVPIVSNVSYSSVFGRDSLHVRPQLSDNIPESKNKCLKILHPTISYNIPTIFHLPTFFRAPIFPAIAALPSSSWWRSSHRGIGIGSTRASIASDLQPPEDPCCWSRCHTPGRTRSPGEVISHMGKWDK